MSFLCRRDIGPSCARLRRLPIAIEDQPDVGNHYDLAYQNRARVPMMNEGPSENRCGNNPDNIDHVPRRGIGYVHSGLYCRENAFLPPGVTRIPFPRDASRRSGRPSVAVRG